MARLPRPTVMPSKISAISTNTVISSAVKNSPMAEAATSAMVIESSIVMRGCSRSATASLKMGYPPIRTPANARMSIPLTRGTTRSQTRTSRTATKPTRAHSIQPSS